MNARTGKITGEHLRRRAYVYVRQSTAFQVAHHRESTERQYNLRQRAVALGWSADTVDVIDEDQGQSGASAEHRTGFQRLITDVSLGRVGIVLMLEASRLARSCADWHRLIEICSVARTVIADEQGVYEPREPNDRLLLGVKGTLSEAELFTLRTRLHEGRWNKARKGELIRSVPTGFVIDADGTWEKDPDRQVRERLDYVFGTFRRLGVARRVLLELRDNRLKLPVRAWGGSRHGQLAWKDATLGGLLRILKNPAYGGTYAYGQWSYDGARRSPKTGKSTARMLPPEEWPVCLLGHHDGYVPWEEYLHNLQKLRQNWFRSVTRGAPREGAALLQGIVWCGRCGAKMGVNTHAAGEKRRPSYICAAAYQREASQATCQSMTSGPVDDIVVTLFLEAMAPAQLEVSLRVVNEVKAGKERLKRQWDQQLEQARYEVRRAERQYDAVDPDNRLVAATLEQRWNDKLEALQTLEDAFGDAQRNAQFEITADEQERVRALTQDLPAVWNATTTTDRERKQLLRYAVSEVQLDGIADKGRIEIRVTWRSGTVTVRTIDRLKVGSWAPRTLPTVVDRIRALASDHTATEIASLLDAEGMRSAHGKILRAHHVLYIGRSRGITVSNGKRIQ